MVAPGSPGSYPKIPRQAERRGSRTQENRPFQDRVAHSSGAIGVVVDVVLVVVVAVAVADCDHPATTTTTTTATVRPRPSAATASLGRTSFSGRPVPAVLK